MTTYTLDAYIPAEGRYVTDRGLTAREVANARKNAPLMGVTILNVFRDDEPAPMTPEEILTAFSGGDFK